MTGHLVLSTLHANDSLSTIPRLLGLGIQPSILADALVGVVSQRLCRMLCAKCKTEVSEPYTEDEQLFTGSHVIIRHTARLVAMSVVIRVFAAVFPLLICWK